MRFRKTTTSLLVVALSGALALTGCSEGLGVSQAGKDYAADVARTTLEQQMTGLGLQDVTIEVQDEDETIKVTSSAQPPAKRANTSATAKPPTTTPSAAPTAKVVKFRVLSAEATYPPAFRCGFNVEWRLNESGVLTGRPYFDEVLVPGTNGVEVNDEARGNVTFRGMAEYMFTRHPECVIPGVTVAPTAPAATPATTGPSPTR